MDWAELLPDLLSAIAKKLNLYEDLTAFGGVCRSWRSVAAVKNNFSLVNVPWLLLAPREDGVNNNSRDFCSLTKGGMVHTVHLPEARDKRLHSCLGWLITIDRDGDVELLHPLSRARITLPSAREYMKLDSSNCSPLGMFTRAALSASPSETDNYAVLILVGPLGTLAYWKPGNTTWVTIKTRRLESFHNVVYHSGHFYAINRNRPVELFSIDITTAAANLVGTLPSDVIGNDSCYLAESGGHLLVVVRKVLHDDDQRMDRVTCGLAAHHHHGIVDCTLINKPIHGYLTSSFKVYRFDSSANWHVMNDLGGRSLFLGQGCAPVSVPCAAVGAANIKPDCIYFTDNTNLAYIRKDDIGRNGIDMGVYSLKEERANTLYQGGTKGRRCFLCPPLWVIPSF